MRVSAQAEASVLQHESETVAASSMHEVHGWVRSTDGSCIEAALVGSRPLESACDLFGSMPPLWGEAKATTQSARLDRPLPYRLAQAQQHSDHKTGDLLMSTGWLRPALAQRPQSIANARSV